MAEKIENVYEFDFNRTRSRVDLVMHSFEGAPNVDNDELLRAWKLFDQAFASLNVALNL